jgi:hypothetical protein
MNRSPKKREKKKKKLQEKEVNEQVFRPLSLQFTPFGDSPRKRDATTPVEKTKLTNCSNQFIFSLNQAK